MIPNGWLRLTESHWRMPLGNRYYWVARQFLCMNDPLLPEGFLLMCIREQFALSVQNNWIKQVWNCMQVL